MYKISLGPACGRTTSTTQHHIRPLATELMGCTRCVACHHNLSVGHKLHLQREAQCHQPSMSATIHVHVYDSSENAGLAKKPEPRALSRWLLVESTNTLSGTKRNHICLPSPGPRAPAGCCRQHAHPSPTLSQGIPEQGQLQASLSSCWRRPHALNGSSKTACTQPRACKQQPGMSPLIATATAASREHLCAMLSFVGCPPQRAHTSTAPSMTAARQDKPAAFSLVVFEHIVLTNLGRAHQLPDTHTMRTGVDAAVSCSTQLGLTTTPG